MGRSQISNRPVDLPSEVFVGCLQEPTAKIYSGAGRLLPSLSSPDDNDSNSLVVASNGSLDMYRVNDYRELDLVQRLKLSGRVSQCALFKRLTRHKLRGGSTKRRKTVKNDHKNDTNGPNDEREWIFITMAESNNTVMIDTSDDFKVVEVTKHSKTPVNEAPNPLISVSPDYGSIVVHRVMGYLDVFKQKPSDSVENATNNNNTKSLVPKFRDPVTYTLDFLTVKAMACLNNEQLLVLGVYATEYRLNLVNFKSDILTTVSELSTLEHDYQNLYPLNNTGDYVLLFGVEVLSIWSKQANEIIHTYTNASIGLVVDFISHPGLHGAADTSTNVNKNNDLDCSKELLAVTTTGKLLAISVKFLDSAFSDLRVTLLSSENNVRLPPPTGLSHIRDNLFFVSSSTAESVLFELETIEEPMLPPKFNINICDKLDNAAPIFCLDPSLDRNSNLQIATCSNGPPRGSLKRIKFGAEINTIGITQFNHNVTNSWVLNLSNEIYWVISYDTSTQFYRILSCDELEDASDLFENQGLSLYSPTLTICQVGQVVYQVTRDKISSSDGELYYSASGSSGGKDHGNVTRAYYDASSGVLAYAIDAGRTLRLLSLGGSKGSQAQIAEKTFENEIHGIYADSNYIYLSFWCSGNILQLQKQTLASVKGISVKLVEGKYVALPIVNSAAAAEVANPEFRDTDMLSRQVINDFVVIEDSENNSLPCYFIGLDRGEVLVVRDPDLQQRSYWTGHTLPTTCSVIGANKVLVSSDYSAIINDFNFVNLGLEQVSSVNVISDTDLFEKGTLFITTQDSLQILKLGKLGASIFEEVELPDICRAVINYDNRFYIATVLEYDEDLDREKLDYVLPKKSSVKLIDYNTLNVYCSLDIGESTCIAECIELLDGVKVQNRSGPYVSGPQFAVSVTQWQQDIDSDGTGTVYLCSVVTDANNKFCLRIDDQKHFQSPVYLMKNARKSSKLLLSTDKKILRLDIDDGKFNTARVEPEVVLTGSQSFTAVDSNDEGREIIAADLFLRVLSESGNLRHPSFSRGTFISNLKYLHLGSEEKRLRYLATAGNVATWQDDNGRDFWKNSPYLCFEDTVNAISTEIRGLESNRSCKDGSAVIHCLIGTADGGIYYVGTMEPRSHGLLLTISLRLKDLIPRSQCAIYNKEPEEWTYRLYDSSNTYKKVLNWGCFVYLLKLPEEERTKLLKQCCDDKISADLVMSVVAQMDPLKCLGIDLSVDL